MSGAIGQCDRAGEREGGLGPGCNRRVIVMEEVAASY